MQKPFYRHTYLTKLINGYISLVSQTYTGDINILPASRFLSPAKVLAARTPEEVMELLHEGERATWPTIERIRIQTHVSRTLNDIIEDIDANILNGGRRAAHPKRKVTKKIALVDKADEKKSA